MGKLGKTVRGTLPEYVTGRQQGFPRHGQCRGICLCFAINKFLKPGEDMDEIKTDLGACEI